MGTESHPSVDQIRAWEDEHWSGAVARRPITIVRGQGAVLWDAEGGEYIDCSAAHGWAALGHSHPDVVAAVQEQAAVLMSHTESSYHDVRARWFAELVSVLGEAFPANERGALSVVMPSNSGAEAVEGALKFARMQTGRPEFVTFHRGFHGRTFGALSATATGKYKTPFEPLVPGFRHVPLNDNNRLGQAVTDRTAAVVVEVIQGEGGVREASPAFLDQVGTVCRNRGTLLIVDEIQTGFGRTGSMFASAAAGVQPDIIVLGKALGGGIPMGAAVWRAGLGRFEPGLHGSTFAGAPLACAASRATMRVLQRDGLVPRARTVGDRMLAALRRDQSDVVREVRGRGLMIGLELRTRVAPLLKRLLERGVWALPAGPNVLRFLPPLVIEDAQVDRVLQAVREVTGAG